MDASHKSPFSTLRDVRLAGPLAYAAITAFVLCLSCFAQAPTSSSNATVKNKSVSVHSQMDLASPVVRSLKKGQPLVLDFQIAGMGGDWCGVAMPGQSARLGYVPCSTLAIRPSPEPSGPTSSAESAGQPGIGQVPQPAIHLSPESRGAHSSGAYAQIKRLVVHDDEIDTLKMEELDREARTGNAEAMDRAAIAHIAAGDFDLSESETAKAVDQFAAATQLALHNRKILYSSLVDLAYVHLIRSEFDPASQSLARAQKIEPDSPVVAQLSGWADYGLDRLSDAVAQWQKAQRLKPNPEVAALLAKARRDQQTESDFHRQENSHFILRYEGGATPELAQNILDALEGDFQTLQSALQFTPAQPIIVILYTGQTFRDITRAPRWSAAINDGRIRIPVQGLTSVTPDLARVLRHELTHSFVRQMTDGRCPTWLNEGLAQWFGGRRSNQDAAILVALYKRNKYIPFSDLEGSWLNFPTPMAVYAYAWSLAAVESIIANSGMYGIQRLFIRLKEEDSARQALDRALQLSYSDLALQTVEYLQRTYLN